MLWKQGQGPWARISMPGVLRAWSRMEAVGSGWALPHSPTNSSFRRERCEPRYGQGPGHRPLCQDCSRQCPGPELKVLLHHRMANSLPWLLVHSPKSQKTNLGHSEYLGSEDGHLGTVQAPAMVLSVGASGAGGC